MEHTGMTCANGHPLDERPDLPVEERQPCPECGSLGRKHFVSGADTIRLTASLQWEHRHEFWERNRNLLVVLGIITVGSPLVGLVIAGLPGVFIGLALGVLGAVIGAKAIVRVREV